MNIKLVLSYDGTHFLGWQTSKDGPTIEETLQNVLEQIYQEPLPLQAASRTDAGVHAEGQVVNFFPTKQKDLEVLQRSLNQLLPQTIRVKSITRMSDAFHPTLDAIGKEYHYFLSLSPVQCPFLRLNHWHLPFPLNLALMVEGASYLIGTHDFSSFCNAQEPRTKETVRTLHRIELTQLGETLRIEVEGKSFLYKMVRNIVGTLVYLGQGKLSLEEVKNLLKTQDRTCAGVTAPAHGLILKKVFYP